MTAFELIAALISMAALFAWINHRWIRLPVAIGLMVISLVMSVVLVALSRAGVGWVSGFLEVVAAIDFDEALLHGMLGALLFAGALHVNLDDLARERGAIAILATGGVLLSTAVVGLVSWSLFGALGLAVPLGACLVLGAIVSPTDPIAVSALLRKAGVPDALLVKVTGESLFNDGIGVVVFLLALAMAQGGQSVDAPYVTRLIVREVVGGLAWGALVGFVAFRMLRSVDQYTVEILVTLAVVTGGYAMAHKLHVSGPLAMVVAGIFLGNQGRALAMSDTTRARLDSFWELVDEFLNAVLFVLIGVEVVAVDFAGPVLVAAALTIPVALAARWVSVLIPIAALRPWRRFSKHAVKVLTWSGLKGGISVALALSLPEGPHRGLIVTATYFVVCFSIIVQGLTVGPFVARLFRRP